MHRSLEGIYLTHHAQTRMAQRGLRTDAVLAAIDFGREIRTRGAWLYVIGRKDITRAQAAGFDIAQYEGVHVIRGVDGQIITVYRNRHNLNLRPHSRRRHRRIYELGWARLGFVRFQYSNRSKCVHLRIWRSSDAGGLGGNR